MLVLLLTTVSKAFSRRMGVFVMRQCPIKNIAWGLERQAVFQ